jgi:hypothetical protein
MLVHDATVAIAATGQLQTFHDFVQWALTLSWPDVLEGASGWLQACGTEATVFLLRCGEGWSWTFEDDYQPHELQIGAHSCRPSFADLGEARLPALRAAQGTEALHRAYLHAAADASRSGAILWRGVRRWIGGTGWCAQTNGAGVFEIRELGALEKEHGHAREAVTVR